MGKYDAIVVGGGFAGVTAAREMASKGLRTILVEARDRLGGKTFTSSFAGRKVEMGGMSIHWFQPHVWTEITRYGLATMEAEPLDMSVEVSTSKADRLDKAATSAREKALLEQFLEGFKDVFNRPYQPLLNEDSVAALDRMSLRDRLEQLELSQKDREWLTRKLTHMAGDLDASLTMLVRWFALAGWKYDLWAEAFTRHRFADGTSSLIDAIASDQDIEILLSSPVSEISQDGDQGVSVVTRNGQTLSADVAVIATPVNMWSSITFTPPLSEVHLKAAKQGMAIRNSTKMWLHVRGNTDRVSATWPVGSAISALRSEVRLPDGQQILVAFTQRPDFDLGDRDLIERTLADALPGAELVDLIAQDWGQDEFSQGASPFQWPTQLSTMVPQLQQPSGRLLFATSDIANGWSGYIDGAIESGITAGRMAGHLVNRSSYEAAVM